MNTIVKLTDIRAAWEALEMEILVPAHLRDEDFVAILAAREHMSGDVFAAQLPMTVAHFKQASRQEIYARARVKGIMKEDDFIAKKFQEDVDKINRIFFGTGVEQPSALLGIFDQPVAAHLHADEYYIPNVFYLSRLFSLPLMVVRHQSQWLTDHDNAKLIFSARHDIGDRDVAARQSLTELGILEKCPLGDVVMLRFGISQYDLKGTLHASSPISGRAKVSTLMRVKGQNLPSFR